MKILFIGNTRLGDAILSTSILNYLDNKNNKITVICSSLSKEIYSSFTAVEKLIVLKKKKRSLHWLDAYLYLEKARWDLVVDLRNSVLSRLIRKKKIFRYKQRSISRHKVEEYCDLMNLDLMKSLEIPTKEVYKRNIEKIIKNYKINFPILAIAPSTNWQRKNWPLENFSDLIKRLFKKEEKCFASIVLLGNKGEKKDCERLKKSLSCFDVYNFAGTFSILEILALLNKCKLYIGNDSGLTHLAATSKSKTLALFGPSRNDIYRPWGENSHFIRTPETYSQLVEVKDYSRFDKTSLMKNLKVKDVFKKCFEII